MIGDKSAVRSGAAFDQRLSLVDESVWERFSAAITYRKRLPFPLQNKFHATGKAMNAAWLDRAADTHAAI